MAIGYILSTYLHRAEGLWHWYPDLDENKQQHFMITGWKRCRILILAGSHNSVYMLLTLFVCRIITNSRMAPITIYSWASHVIISYQVSRCRGVKCQSGFTVTQHSPARLSSEVATISCKFMEISNEGCFVNIIPLQTVATTQQL